MSPGGLAVGSMAAAKAATIGGLLDSETSALAASIGRSRPPGGLVNSRTGS